jgi:DNA replication protein DnaC
MRHLDHQPDAAGQLTSWRGGLNEPTRADAILDRIVHTAHKIALKGQSMRKKQIKP